MGLFPDTNYIKGKKTKPNPNLKQSIQNNLLNTHLVFILYDFDIGNIPYQLQNSVYLEYHIFIFLVLMPVKACLKCVGIDR